MQIQSGLTAGLFQSSQSLTDAQKTSLAEVIGQYDADDLSDEDAKALVSEISGLGISAGSDLNTALSDAGIDPKGLADQAGIGRGDGPPSPLTPSALGTTPDSKEVQTLLAIMQDLRAQTEAEGTQDDFTALLTQALEDAGYDLSEPNVDFRA